jgi:hypothetical protein
MNSKFKLDIINCLTCRDNISNVIKEKIYTVYFLGMILNSPPPCYGLAELTVKKGSCCGGDVVEC